MLHSKAKLHQTAPMKRRRRGDCDCSKGHEDQITKYPVDATVIALGDIPGLDGSGVPKGMLGQVSWHCNDGRATIKFENGQCHTFHFPEQHVEITNLRIKAEALRADIERAQSEWAFHVHESRIIKERIDELKRQLSEVSK